MSKHRTNTTIWNRLRRGLAGILSLALLIGLLPASIAPAAAADHWAMPYAQQLLDWGVMRGDTSGALRLEDSITRAEFVTMMNRAYGYTRLGTIPFTDVSRGSWYYEDINIAYNMGYFQGTSPTTASPNSALTREQAAVLLARNMMLQPTVGETLGFSDTRSLAEWSRGLVGAATENGILSGYSDGTFKPQNNITRGEVAAMLARAIGTPIQTEGDHTLGNVYGNVTVNTSGVKLRDGVIAGNLYLTGGIDLGDVLMENVTVLGEIIVSGGGESNSSESSIVLRNVTANSMTVDSVSDQFVTIRAEGNTDIKTTTVRTNAYVDDASLPGYGLWKIIQDGGSLLQLAGNVKEVINQTPNSELQVVEGVAEKITIDEKATGSSVLVDGDARVNELDLDVATKVTGEGDIEDLNVGAAGSSVEQLPDNITIRPGITADINGSEMNSVQAAESSAEPRLLAGYPRAKNVAPNSATLVFSANKTGTIYWAVSAVSDGSVSEDDLIEKPAYGGKIVASGTINVTAANTEYTANVTGLTQDGSYYISAILVDGREKRSPVKVAAFATPDGTVPAFLGNPTVTMHTTKIAQVTGMPNKSCLLYWALLPEGAAAPTGAQFKANAVTGNLGYGSMDVVKNVSQSVNVNRGVLREKTNYVAYLWLTDYDGAKSSQVYRVPIYIPDETPPEVNDVSQTGSDATAVEVTFTMNETGKLYWAIVTDEIHEKELYLEYDNLLPEGENADRLYIEDPDVLLASKIKVMSGVGAGNNVIVSGNTNVTAADTPTRILTSAAKGLDPKIYNTSSFVIYYVGEDTEGNLSNDIGFLEVTVSDKDSPTLVEQRFTSFGGSDRVHPLADTGVQLIFSESIQRTANVNEKMNQFLRLYQAVESAAEDKKDEAREALSLALAECIQLYLGDSATPVPTDRNPSITEPVVLDYRYAQVSRDNGQMIITFPHNVTDANGNILKGEDGEDLHCINLNSGATYHFELTHIYDLAGNPLKADDKATTPTVAASNGIIRVQEFRVASAQVDVDGITLRPRWMAMAKDGNDVVFTSTPLNGSKPSSVGTGALNADPIEARSIGSNQVTHYVDVFPAYKGTTSSGTLETDQAALNRAEINDPSRIDASFMVHPTTFNVDPSLCYEMLIWADTNIEFTLYARPRTQEVRGEDGSVETAATPWSVTNTASWNGAAQIDKASWTRLGSANIIGASKTGSTSRFGFTSLFGNIQQTLPDFQANMTDMEYAIHVDKVTDGRYGQQEQANEWNEYITFRITLVTGDESTLDELKFNPPSGTTYEDFYNSLVARENGLTPISDPEHEEIRVQFTDSLAPEIEYITFVNSDTQPEINVKITRPGTIHCVAVPLFNVKYVDKNGNSTTPQARESIIDFLAAGNEISSYEMLEAVILEDGTQGGPENLNRIPYTRTDDDPLVDLSAPSAVKLTGSSSSFAANSVKGTATTQSATTLASVKFESDLAPNTIYLLCMAPQGSTTESLTDMASGFYFITEFAKRPVITLTDGNRTDGGGADVNVQVNTNAAVWSVLVYENRLEDTPMAGLFNASAIDSTKYAEFYAFAQAAGLSGITYDESTNTLTFTKKYTYSILDALRDNYESGSSPFGSVFDYFADTYLKNRIREFVETSNQGGVVVGRWNSGEAISANRVTTMNFEKNDMMVEGRTYICFTIARTSLVDTGAEHGFRAYSPVELQSSEAPKITSANFSQVTYGPFGISGAITLTFDKELYLDTTSGRKILAQSSATGSAGGNYWGLDGLFGGQVTDYYIPDITPTGPRDNFTIGFNPVLGRMAVNFNLPDGLCSYWMIHVSGNISINFDENEWKWVITVPDDIKASNYQEISPPVPKQPNP